MFVRLRLRYAKILPFENHYGLNSETVQTIVHALTVSVTFHHVKAPAKRKRKRLSFTPFPNYADIA